MSRVSATVLHIKAVRDSLQQHGHQVRLMTFNHGRIQWTDDLVHWHPSDLGHTRNQAFRGLERAVRGIQSRLHLPYFNLFDSHRFSEACVAAVADCDILYERFWLLAYGGLVASKRLGIPLIYEVNGDLVAEYRQLGMHLTRAQWAVVHFVTRCMFRHVAHVVSVSETLKHRICQRWRVDPAKVSAVSNGARVSLFTDVSAEEVKDVRDRYGIDCGPVVAFVGTFKPWHGLDVLLDAFAQVATATSRSRLLLIGDGPLRAALEEKAVSLHLADRLIFTGLVPHKDIPGLLHAADIAVVNPKVSAASAAQSPLKLFEYMAAGKAVVAPEIPSIKQVLTDHQNGILVPPGDSDTLASALLELIDDDQLRTRLGQAAKQQAMDRHSWDSTVSEIETIMYNLAGSS